LGDNRLVQHGRGSSTRRTAPSSPSSFWELWWVRLASVVLLMVAIVGAAVAGDPDHESWQAKTWELLHSIAATSVGHR